MKKDFYTTIAISLVFLIAAAPSMLDAPEIHDASMSAANFIDGEGDGLPDNVFYRIELFLNLEGDFGGLVAADIDFRVDGNQISIDQVDDVDFDGTTYSVSAGVDFGSTPHPQGLYSVSVEDGGGVTSNVFVIGDLKDYPKDAPDLFNPMHLQPFTDPTPTFSWEEFQSNYDGSLVDPWSYEINLSNGDFYSVFPISPSQTTLNYVNPDWDPSQPLSLSPGFYGVNVHSNHFVAERINFEHHRQIRVIVYDPEGGFITGGGWIDSPNGAYIPNGDIGGEARFGFNAKYKKNSDVPGGELEFQLQEADLNFHSEDFDVLIISDAKATLTGNGTINGNGNFNFYMNVTDGKLDGSGVDTILFAIWDPESGEDIYYTDGELQLQGGNIVIHK